MTFSQRLRQNLNLWFCSIKVLRPYKQQSTHGAVLLGVAADGRFPSNVVADNSVVTLLSKPGGLESIARSVMYAAFTKTNIPIYNAGMLDDIDGFDDLDVDDIQLEQYLKVLVYLMAGHFPITIGCADSISIANYQALSAHLYQQQYHQQHHKWYGSEYTAGNNKIGIINFDPNFELRLTPSPKLDSAFHAVNQYCLETFRIFNYLGLGICKRTNSVDTFDYAKQLGCDWLLDKHMSITHCELIEETLARFIEQVDHIHLSVDLAVICEQVLQSKESHSSQTQGILLEILIFALTIIARSGKLKMLDIVTLNPELEYSHKTAAYVSSIICPVLQHLKVSN